MIVSLIAAIDKNNGIGRGNQLLIKIPDDLKRFKKLTTGHTVIMGHKTYESIGHALPDRTNIVLSRKVIELPGCIVMHSINQALDYAREQGETEAFVIGGGEIFKLSLPMADKLYLTIVDAVYNADTFFPPYGEFDKIESEEEYEYNGLKYKFINLTR